jgi:hypothetical protein
MPGRCRRRRQRQRLHAAGCAQAGGGLAAQRRRSGAARRTAGTSACERPTSRWYAQRGLGRARNEMSGDEWAGRTAARVSARRGAAARRGGAETAQWGRRTRDGAAAGGRYLVQGRARRPHTTLLTRRAPRAPLVARRPGCPTGTMRRFRAPGAAAGGAAGGAPAAACLADRRRRERPRRGARRPHAIRRPACARACVRLRQRPPCVRHARGHGAAPARGARTRSAASSGGGT